MDFPMFYSYDTSILNHRINDDILRHRRVERDDTSTTVDFLLQSGLILVDNAILYRWECLNDHHTPTIGVFAILATRVVMTSQKIMLTNDASPRFTVCVPIKGVTTTAIAHLQSTVRRRTRQRRALAVAMASHSGLGASSSLSTVLGEPSMLMLILSYSAPQWSI